MRRGEEESTGGGEGTAVNSMHAIRSLVEQMRESLRKGDFRRFGLLLHEGWEAKRKISEGVSNPFIDQLYSEARRNVALGGKITGAGGGGFLLLFCEEQDQPSVREAMLGLGVRAMRLRFDV